MDGLVFIDAPRTEFKRFSGTIHGNLAVYHDHVRRDRDIVPIRLVLDGPGPGTGTTGR